MQRKHRISGTKRHSQIHREGNSLANRLLVVRYMANGLDYSRFAFVVSRRVGNAVVRNRIKRRLRESVRCCPVTPGWDAVFIARRGSQDADYHDLSRAARNLLRRSRIAVDEGRQNFHDANSRGVSNSGGESSQ